MSLQTTNFDQATGLMSKNIKFNTVAVFEAYQKECWKFCKKNTTDQKQEQVTGYEGFGATPEKAEGSDILPVDFKEGYKTIIAQKSYAYEVRVSWEQRRFATKSAEFAKQVGYYLGRSAAIRYEYIGADILNNGFTDSAAFWGGDSKPLFSASHPFKMGGTYSNVLTAGDLSKTTLISALKTIHSAKMENSIPTELQAKQIIIGVDNVFTLPELLKSSLDPSNANNTYNAIQDYNLEKVLSHFLSDTDSWYVTTGETDLQIVEANAPFMSTEAYNNKDIGENVWLSVGSGFTNALGVYGNQGS